jgi:peptidoglycan L-alanyl-D-glutamate endopeptidase CwlK
VNKDITKLNPCFAVKLHQLFARARQAGISLGLLEGYRSPERQLWLYTQGRTRPGKKVTRLDGVICISRHASGVAADIFIKDEHGQYTHPSAVPDTAWAQLGQISDDLGLTWGGSWADFVDKPHFEAAALMEATAEQLDACREQLERMPAIT